MIIFLLNLCAVMVHCSVIVQFVIGHRCDFLPTTKSHNMLKDLLIITQSLVLYKNYYAQLNPAVSNS